MPRTPSRTKKTSYVLQVTCDKLPHMNEKEFLEHVRTSLMQEGNIGLNKQLARVSVIKRVEEFIRQQARRLPRSALRYHH